MRTKTFLLIAAHALILALTPGAFASSPWTGAGNGYAWEDPKNWTGNTLPAAGESVVIPAVANGQTIQISTATGTVQIGSLTSSEPINISGSTLQVATTFQAAANVTLSGGTLKSATLTVSGSASITLNGGTLDGLTLGSKAFSNGLMTVIDGLTLANGAVLKVIGAGQRQITFVGTQTLGGTGEISGVFGSYDNPVVIGVQGTTDNLPAGAATLTIGAGVLIHGSGEVHLQLVQNYDRIVNLGTINTDGGQSQRLEGLGTANTLVNKGTIEATSGQLFFSGLQVDNTAGNITYTAQNYFQVTKTTIKGGTLAGMLLNGDVTLDGVTFNGDTVALGGPTTVIDGLTLANGAVLKVIGAGQRQITFVGTQTLGGTGEISGVFGSYDNPVVIGVQGTTDNLPAGAATLTIGAGVLIHGSGEVHLQLVQNYDRIVNLGTINTDGGQSQRLEGLGTANTLVNKGTIEATSGQLFFSGLQVDNTAGNITYTAQNYFQVTKTTIKGGTLAGMLLNGDVTLDGVTFNGDTVALGGPTTVIDGLTLANGAVLKVIGAGQRQITFVGTQTLGGTGEISGVFGSYDNPVVIGVQGTTDNLPAGAATLTIGPGVLIDGPGQTYLQCVQNYDRIVNLGTINADGNTVGIDGLGTSNTLVNYGTLEATSATLDLNGLVLTNDGSILQSGSGRVLVDSNASLRGGTLAGTIPYSATLDGVTITADTTVPVGVSLTILHGLTLANNARLTLVGNSQRILTFVGTQTLGGKGELICGGTQGQAGFVYVQGTSDAPTGAATLTVGADILIHGTQSLYLADDHAYDSFVNQGAIDADTSGVNLVVQCSQGSVTDLGRLGAHNGGSLLISAPLTINGSGLVDIDAKSYLFCSGNVLGNSTGLLAGKVQGLSTLTGTGTATVPLQLEAMAQDLGHASAAFNNNFVFGSLAFSGGYVQLVDYVRNASGTTNEAVYAQSVSVPANCTLDLNGLQLYTHAASISGTVLHGTVNVFSDAGPLAYDTPMLGNIVTGNVLDAWTVFARAGSAVSVVVNPGPNGSPVPPTPSLQAARVQLVDPSGNVLASASSATAGAVVTLSGITAPIDGTYSIRVGAAPTNTSATGHYYITASETTANEFALAIDAPSVGDINAADAVDHWNFSATVNTQVQFHVVNSSSAAVGFQLVGPNNTVVFHDLTADSAIINLPATGNYVLSVYSLNGGTGTYDFVLNQTTVTALTVGTTLKGNWAGDGDARLYTVANASTYPLDLSLTTQYNDQVNHTEIYARFGAPPTRDTYDFAANDPSPGQELVVPKPKVGTYYILVYAEHVTTPSFFNLLAKSEELVLNTANASIALTGTTADQSTVYNNYSVTLNGYGFTPGTTVLLQVMGQTGINPINNQPIYGPINVPGKVTLTSANQLVATFSVQSISGGQAAFTGPYTVIVSQPDHDAVYLPAAIVAADKASLQTQLEVPNPIGRHIASTLYVIIKNVGANPIPAPLVSLTAANPKGAHGAFFTLDPTLQDIGFWSATLPTGFSTEIEILGSGASPGILQPGETVRVPVYYSGWIYSQWDFTDPTLNFSLSTISADQTDPVDFIDQEDALRPSFVSKDAWPQMYVNLLSQFPAQTNGGYVQFLDTLAASLGSVGENVTDVGKLLTYALFQAGNYVPLPGVAATADDTLPVPGALAMNFTRTFNNTLPGRYQTGILGLGWYTPWTKYLAFAADGSVTLYDGGGSSVYQPDERYSGVFFSQPGDRSKLTTANGLYVLTKADGTATTFNLDGTLNAVQDVNRNTITASYSGGKLVTLIASSGASFNLSYNGSGFVSSLVDSLGRTTTYNYDTTNHLTSVLGYNQQTTTYTYEAQPKVWHNALLSVAAPDGTHLYLGYDNNARLNDAKGDQNTNHYTITYDPGQVTVTDLLGHSSSAAYNENGQLCRSVDGNGNATFYSYDANHNLVTKTNPFGTQSNYAYDSLNRLTSLTDYDGGTTKFAYAGTSSHVAQLTDANGNASHYAYDAAGNAQSATAPNGHSALYSYNAQGLPVSSTDGAGLSVQRAYNAAGQLTMLTFPDKSTYVYAYDTEGKMISAKDVHGTNSFTYDPVTRLLTTSTDATGKTLTYSYNAVGHRTKMVDQSGYTTNYAYDAAGRLSALTDGQGQPLVAYLYGADGRITQTTKGNGTYTTFAYDPAGYLLSTVNYAPSGTVNSRFDDTYDGTGHKVSEITLDGTWTYTYSQGGQLTHAGFVANANGKVPAQSLDYAYDAMGNRTSTVVNGVTTAYATNGLNEYANIGGKTFSYDDNGSLLADGTNTYTYDALHRPASVISAAHKTSYSYDALGNRVSATRDGAATTFLVDPVFTDRPVAAYDASGNTTSRFVFGVGLVGEATAGGLRGYDFDPIGNTCGITGGNGAYLNQYRSLPFGEGLTASETVPSLFQFNGQWGAQSQDGVSFMSARNYSPGTGKFASLDPAGLAGGINLTLFVFNNPLTLVDPQGTFPSFKSIAENTLTFAAGVLAIGATVVSLPVDAAVGVVVVAGTGVAVAGYGIGAALNNVGRDDADQNPTGPSQQIATLLGSGPGTNGNSAAILVDTVLGGKPSDIPSAISGTASLLATVYDHIAGTTPDSNTTTQTADAQDPNALFGPAGYGTSNFVGSTGNAYVYRVTFENAATASAPAQVVTIKDPLSPSLDWSTFQLSGIGFGDFFIPIPDGSQHFQTTVMMTYNGDTFNVQVEAGIHRGTGEVYAIFQSIDPTTGLPPANVLTGFLPPENGTGRGDGYLAYTVSPVAGLVNGAAIRNVAAITFDEGTTITTDQVNDEDPSQGVDPGKQALVTVDTTTPTAQVTALPAHDGPNITVAWSGADAGGSGIAGYTVYVSSDGGQTYSAWLTNTTATSGVYPGVAGKTYTFYVVATSNVGTVESIATAQADTTTTTVDFAPDVTSAATAEVVAGQPFMYQISGDNAPTSFGASPLPAGLGINTGSGLISGTPTQAGVFTITVSVTNGSGTGTAVLTLTVDPAPVVYPVITSAATATVLLGQPFTYQITASDNPASFNATGLPPGLSVNTASGLISGAPTQVGSFNVALSATNASGTGTDVLTLTVAAPAVVYPVITSAASAMALAGHPFSYQVTATNDPTAFSAAGLPAGLGIDPSSGAIAGTPTTPGVFAITISAANVGGTGTAVLTLTVGPAPVVTPVIDSVLAVNGQATVPFSYQITASNDPTSFAATGLPDGLGVDAVSGLITGTPTTAGVYAIGLDAANAVGTGTANLVLTVAAAPLPVVTVTATTPKVTAGTGAAGVFTFTLAQPAATDLIVSYALKGSAVNGQDYAKLKTFKKIKAGKTKVSIKVVPEGTLSGALPKVVKLVLQSSADYTLGTTKPVKVKIFRAP